MLGNDKKKSENSVFLLFRHNRKEMVEFQTARQIYCHLEDTITNRRAADDPSPARKYDQIVPNCVLLSIGNRFMIFAALLFTILVSTGTRRQFSDQLDPLLTTGSVSLIRPTSDRRRTSKAGSHMSLNQSKIALSDMQRAHSVMGHTNPVAVPYYPVSHALAPEPGSFPYPHLQVSFYFIFHVFS